MDVDGKPHLLEIVAAMKEVTARVTTADSLHDAADDVVRVTTQILPSHLQCAITLISQGEPAVFATTGLTPEILDEVRHAAGDGPCMQAIRTRDIVVSRDLATDPRWPTWSAKALAHGVRAVLSYPFDVDAPMLAALTLFSGQANGLDGEVATIAMLMADHAGLLLQARLRQSARDAVPADDLTDGPDPNVQRAIGIIMAQRGCPPDQALRHLRDAATHLGAGVAVLADRLVRTVADRSSMDRTETFDTDPQPPSPSAASEPRLDDAEDTIAGGTDHDDRFVAA